MSDLEEQFAFQVRAVGLPAPEREFRFSSRRYRFDFAWVDYKVAVEINGGAWVNGRHNRAAGQQSDNAKANLAVEHGWRVLRYTGAEVEDGSALHQVERVLGGLR